MRIILVLVLLPSLVLAKSIQDTDGARYGFIEDYKVSTVDNERVGRIDADGYLVNRDNARSYSIEDGYIEDNSGARVGRVEDGYIYNEEGARVGRVK